MDFTGLDELIGCIYEMCLYQEKSTDNQDLMIDTHVHVLHYNSVIELVRILPNKKDG